MSPVWTRVCQGLALGTQRRIRAILFHPQSSSLGTDIAHRWWSMMINVELDISFKPHMLVNKSPVFTSKLYINPRWSPTVQFNRLIMSDSETSECQPLDQNQPMKAAVNHKPKFGCQPLSRGAQTTTFQGAVVCTLAPAARHSQKLWFKIGCHMRCRHQPISVKERITRLIEGTP